ncbi:MAG: ATP synthase subunit I [Anaerorhabdus sp.]
MGWIKQTIKPTLAFGVVLAIGLLFVDVRYSISLLLGLGFSILSLYRLERSVKYGIDQQKKRTGWILGFITNFVFLALPFMLAALFPSIFDFFAIAIGLLINKVVLYGVGLKQKGGEDIE